MCIHFCKQRGARHQAELVPWLCSQRGNGSFEDDKLCYRTFSSPIISLEPLVLGGGRDTLTEMELRHFYYVTLNNKVVWWLNEMYAIIYSVHS